MKKITCWTFIAIYAVLSIWLIIELFRYCDIDIGGVAEISIYGVWIWVCYTSYRWMPDFYLSMMRVRKTILEEEEWIHPLMHELNLRSGIKHQPRLLVLEKPEMDAFATGRDTIIVSRGLLVNLSELEIKAVLAHEYGHLSSRDTVAACAFTVASKPILLLYNMTCIIFGFFKNRFWLKSGFWIKMFFAVLSAAAVYAYPELVLLILILFIFMKIFPLFSLVIRAVWCFFCRNYEFKQDDFAQSLGCGKHLKSALLKIDSLNSDSLVNRINQYWLTHPMIYMRIRRLEWLEGLRSTP